MQQIGLAPKIDFVFLQQREQTAGGIPVDDRHSPHIASLFDGFNVGVKVLAALVGVGLVALPVLFVGVEVRAMDGRQQHNLLSGEGAFQRVHRDVDAPLKGRSIHRGCALSACHHRLRLTVSIFHLRYALIPPVADGHTIVVVVGAHKDDDGIHVLPVLLLQQVGLAGNVVPLAPADAIDVGDDVEPLLQEIPKLLLRAAIARVGNAVAQIGHALSLPGMHDGLLRQRRQHQQQAKHY